jgi:glycine oxidase
MSATDVVVIGGGVIGLSTAYVLAGEGLNITILDRDEPGRAASWAGAGILAAPGSRPPVDDPGGQLRHLSARLHPEWADRLREETGLDSGYRRRGGLDLAIDAEEMDALAASEAALRTEGIAVERLDGDAARRLEPTLSGRVHGGLLLPDRAQVRNPRHLRALLAACLRRGVTIRPSTPVESFLRSRDGGSIESVRTTAPDASISAAAFVLSAGPWTSGLARSAGLDIPTPPIKGQIVLLRARVGLVRRILERGPRYLVPRDDGRILIGATEEEAGFDVRTTASAARDLLAFALELAPGLAEAELERSWAGLRPGNGDGRPTIGRVPGISNLYVAAGHRRHGLSLSTGTAVVLAEQILGRTPSIPLGPFQPGRVPAASPDHDVFRS